MDAKEDADIGPVYSKLEARRQLDCCDAWGTVDIYVNPHFKTALSGGCART